MNGITVCNGDIRGARYQEEMALLLICWDGMNACNGEWCEISGRIGIVVETLGWYERM